MKTYRYAQANHPDLLLESRCKSFYTKLKSSDSGIYKIIESIIENYEVRKCFLTPFYEEAILHQLGSISARNSTGSAIQERADRATALIEQHRKEIALTKKKK